MISNPMTIVLKDDILTFSGTPLFEKRTIVELTDNELAEIQGGTTPLCVAAAASSGYCASAAVLVTAFVASAVVGYFS